MNKLSLLAGIAIGAVLTAGVAQLRAQAPGISHHHTPGGVRHHRTDVH